MLHQHQEEENTRELLRRCILTAPSFIDSDIKDEVYDYFLPYDTGIEIECDVKDNYDKELFSKIPNIVENLSNANEQRFRIPKGKKGLFVLFEISKILKDTCLLNPSSGNHYHVDFTDCFEEINNEFISDNNNWVLNELESWKYKGTYNSKKTSFSDNVWMRYYDYHRTIEFRIGEMTFDYSLLLTRILHCQEIAKKLKLNLYKKKIESLTNLKPEQSIKDDPLTPLQIKSIIEQRMIKL